MSLIDSGDQSDSLQVVDTSYGTLKYHSKLVGVTFEGRQDIIKVLTGNEPLRVRREAENEYDKKAVAVDVMFGEDWAPVGYIAKDKNSDISETLDTGNDVYIKLASITGGGTKSFGVNIELEYVKAGAKAEVVPVEKAQTQEVKPNYKNMLKNALEGLGVIGESNKVKYTSRILGKSTDVTVVNGHMRLEGYLSGSAFPKKFYAEFKSNEMLDMMAKKFGVDKAHIKAMWDLNRDASTGYGTSIHAALENYDTYHKLGDKIKSVKVLKTKTNTGPNKALSRNPFLKKVVEDFHEKFGGDYVRLSEQFVWLHDEKLCGSIDRIKVIDAEKKIVRIQDYKTDGDIHEKTYQLSDSPFYKMTQGATPKMGKELLDLHWLQLSFYAYILEQYGYTVEGLDVYWLNPNKLAKGENAWEEFSHDVIKIGKAL